MFESRVLATVVAGIPVSLLCLGYLAVRREEVVLLFTEGGGSEAMTPAAATALAVLMAVAIGPGLGLAAAFVRGWMPSDTVYIALAFGLATLMSLGALAARTPMMAEKVVLNYAVALMLGLVATGLVAAS
jgi:hypothetical protein